MITDKWNDSKIPLYKLKIFCIRNCCHWFVTKMCIKHLIFIYDQNCKSTEIWKKILASNSFPFSVTIMFSYTIHLFPCVHSHYIITFLFSFFFHSFTNTRFIFFIGAISTIVIHNTVSVYKVYLYLNCFVFFLFFFFVNFILVSISVIFFLFVNLFLFFIMIAIVQHQHFHFRLPLLHYIYHFLILICVCMNYFCADYGL